MQKNNHTPTFSHIIPLQTTNIHKNNNPTAMHKI